IDVDHPVLDLLCRDDVDVARAEAGQTLWSFEDVRKKHVLEHVVDPKPQMQLRVRMLERQSPARAVSFRRRDQRHLQEMRRFPEFFLGERAGKTSNRLPRSLHRTLERRSVGYLREQRLSFGCHAVLASTGGPTSRSYLGNVSPAIPNDLYRPVPICRPRTSR